MARSRLPLGEPARARAACRIAYQPLRPGPSVSRSASVFSPGTAGGRNVHQLNSQVSLGTSCEVSGQEFLRTSSAAS